MRAIRVETVVEKDGELHLLNLPCRKGDRVEALVTVPDAGELRGREAARQRFLARARASHFRSLDSYPSRDELHDRT